jgi:MtrB/PioB family decaheme-associated outer membrane protein
MKKFFRLGVVGLIVGFLLLPIYGFSEDETTVQGMSSITFRTVSGERESAKFQEYREIPDGVSGNILLNYRSKNYQLDLTARDIAEDDQNVSISMGRYGRYRIELIYDKLPHRFAFDAKTLYAGTGTGNLVLSDRLQQDLQGNFDGDIVPNQTQLVARLQSYFDGAASTDLELFRENGMVNIDVMALNPFNMRIEFRREEREGTRPFAGSFGFSNVNEIPEPIDYETTSIKFIAEYAQRPFYVSGSYYFSTFRNNIDTLTWGNPFRATDSTSANAYTQTNQNGPSKGLIDLYPGNDYHNFSLTGSYMDLPLRSRVSATISRGWMRQDDALVPYTTNTAITTPSLPASKVDAKVNTSLYNVLFTSRPLSFMHAKAKYRYYRYDNDTEQLQFAHVRFDATLLSDTEENLPTSYNKNTAGMEFAFDVFKATTLTLGYTYDQTKRTHREASKTEDDIYGVSIDTKPLSWIDFKISYERSERDGDYDFRVPFEDVTGDPPQLPFLVKYDEADRDRDRIQLLTTVYPIEPLTVTASATYGKDKFEDSAFGLLEDQHQIYSLDADYALTERLNFNTFYSYERYKNENNARQWVPTTSCIVDADTTSGECTDPYNAVTSLDSPSNWIAESQDRVNTVGAGLNTALIPQKLDFDVTYSFSKTDGEVELSSVVGANIDVDPNNFTPAGFESVDDITIQILHAKLKYQFSKGLSLAVGYLWEIFDISDFSDEGFTFVPTTTTGTFNGALLMGVLPKDYTASVIYTKLTYKF